MSAGARDRRAMLGSLLAFGHEASELILRVYAADFAVEYKGKDDPVTRADKEANALLCDRLERAFPGIPVVAEESDPSTFQKYRTARESFFVDPLDGTREFVAKNGEFCVMIGFAEEGRATLGVIVFPALGRAVAGADGVPSFAVNAVSGTGMGTGARTPIAVSAVDDVRQASLLVSRAHRPEAWNGPELPLGVKALVPCGSSGLKAAKVAEGEAEIYAQPGRAGSLWDVCAPEAIVRNAGGAFTDGNGQLFDYRREDLRCTGGVLATNGRLHAEVLARLAAAIAERRRAP